MSVLLCAAALFLFLGVPCIAHAQRLKALFHAGGADAVSSASLAIPERPSGTFVVLINRAKHPETLPEWERFFREEPTDVIFEDLHCLVIDADPTGVQTAERYQARLAEHQMRVRAESALFAASRVRSGAFDVMICSKEAAEAVSLEEDCGADDVALLLVEADA